MEFRNLEELFDAMKEEEYVILRNYEDFNSSSFLTDHPDIDILCRFPAHLAKVISAYPKGNNEDGLHYAVTVNGKKIPIDMRRVGDGYFDSRWEDRVLKNRLLKENYYIMNAEDYFYTLLYHGLIHKTSISEDYRLRLQRMASELCLEFRIEEGKEILTNYMKKFGYRYTYPISPTTTCYLSEIDIKMIQPSARHCFRKIKQVIRKTIKDIIGRK